MLVKMFVSGSHEETQFKYWIECDFSCTASTFIHKIFGKLKKLGSFEPAFL
jgi:hypothetical protein